MRCALGLAALVACAALATILFRRSHAGSRIIKQLRTGVASYQAPGEATGELNHQSDRFQSTTPLQNLTLEPIYQHWLRTCGARSASNSLGPYGPFSRPLPSNIDAAVPSLEKVVKHIMQGEPSLEIMRKVEAQCKTFQMPNSKRLRGDQAPAINSNSFLQCFTQGQARSYEDSNLLMYGIQLDNVLRRFGYQNRSVFVKFNDNIRNNKEFMPALVKARAVAPQKEEAWPPQILFWLNTGRHFGFNNFFEGLGTRYHSMWKPTMTFAEIRLKDKSADHIRNPPTLVKTVLQDCQSFKKKPGSLLWRGASTGHVWLKSDRRALLKQWFLNADHPEIDVAVTNIPKGLTPAQKLQEHLTEPAARVELAEMLGRRYLLYAEGNDVGSSGAWNLLASSVVMMPKPKAESMVLHGLLEPWVHYIPLKDDFSNLAEQMKWCEDNLDECEDIAHRASIFMYHMWPGSEFADKVTRAVLDQYFSRYGFLTDCVCNQE